MFPNINVKPFPLFSKFGMLQFHGTCSQSNFARQSLVSYKDRYGIVDTWILSFIINLR